MKKGGGSTGKAKVYITTILVILLAFLLIGCSKAEEGYQINKKLDQKTPVTLVVAGQYTDYKALEVLISKFSELYPNCKVVYEYVQDYKNLLPKRLTSTDDRVDLFVASNIQEGSPYLEYSLDLLAEPDKLDLSQTFSGLVDNFKFRSSGETEQLYSIPLGGEMRVLIVNNTLLSSLNIPVPTNQSEFYSACQTLFDNGYIPAQSNPGTFAQQLLFPYIAHLISDSSDPAVRELVASADPAAAEVFRDPLLFLYNLVKSGYYNYKKVENELKLFTKVNDTYTPRYFLNILDNGNGFEKIDDLGQVAFLPSANSSFPIFEKVKEDYHSTIEMSYILAPVSNDGGYAYMSPASGLAINKNSKNLDWCLEFLNFILYPENNILLAEGGSIVPNISTALEYISEKYGIPASQIAQPADVTFDYGFYELINPIITDISKANNPKYMTTDADGNSVMYEFEYYMDKLKQKFAEAKAKMETST